MYSGRRSAYEYVTAEAEKRHLRRFCQMFCFTATLQGRLAYLLMSVHAVNPGIVKRFTEFDPKKCLLVNMLYGIAIMIYCRPSMTPISKFNRVAFSILGSLMFNHSSMLFYGWLAEKIPHRTYLLTLLGFWAGRIMMLHLLAYLYHVDSRNRDFYFTPHAEYETMYRQQF